MLGPSHDADVSYRTVEKQIVHDNLLPSYQQLVAFSILTGSTATPPFFWHTGKSPVDASMAIAATGAMVRTFPAGKAIQFHQSNDMRPPSATARINILLTHSSPVIRSIGATMWDWFILIEFWGMKVLQSNTKTSCAKCSSLSISHH